MQMLVVKFPLVFWHLQICSPILQCCMSTDYWAISPHSRRCECDLLPELFWVLDNLIAVLLRRQNSNLNSNILSFQSLSLFSLFPSLLLVPSVRVFPWENWGALRALALCLGMQLVGPVRSWSLMSHLSPLMFCLRQWEVHTDPFKEPVCSFSDGKEDSWQTVTLKISMLVFFFF